MKRAESKAATRQKIIDAARVAFLALGYHGVNLRLLAASAGLSTGAIFANFKGKDELYVEVYGHPPISPEEGRALMLELRSRQDATQQAA